VVPAVTADQMREVDKIAIEETGPNLYQMMENAGRSLAQKTIDMLGETWRDSAVLVLAGVGGNGGGGICAARHLANRGIDVRLVISDESRLSGVPADQLSVYRATKGQLGKAADLEDVEASLVVDALIGYSLNGPPRGAPLELIDWVSTTDSPVLSLDVPSGVNSTTGESPESHVTATETLTLALPKTGLNVEAVGSLSLADIGIPHEVYRRAEIDVPGELFDDRWIVPVQPR
jgi:NAD(P)H-hydrate epimerase